MKTTIFLLLVVGLLSCNTNDQNDPASVTAADSTGQYVTRMFDDSDQSLMDSLMQVPFVAEADAYIDSISNHTHRISFLADTISPTEVHLQVGYNNTSRFETYFLFYFNPATKTLMVNDPVTDTRMTVEAYQKTLQ